MRYYRDTRLNAQTLLALLLHYLDDLDSKMECMRALIEKDQLVDGVWTGYNSALERSALKKGKFLESGSKPPVAKPTVAAAKPVAAALPVLPPSDSSSPFADKLKQALGPKQ